MKAKSMILLLAGATLLLAGCDKQNIFGGKYSRKAGEAVVFGVGSGNLETRTAYGDVNTVNNKKIQDINWVEGDKIRIYSPEAQRRSSAVQWADYIVTPVSGTLNKGTLTNVQTHGLVWGTSGTYHFYSVYPSPLTEEENVPANGTAGKFGFTIPAAQLVTDEMEYAFMTAAAEVTTTADENAVELDFYPAYTAFEIRLNSEADLVLKSFKLLSEDTALTGDFTVTYSGTTPAYAATGTGKEISIDDLGDAAVNATDALVFNVFTLPIKQSGLSIRFTYAKADNPDVTESRLLRLNYADGDPVEFAANKKHVITGTLKGNWYFKYIKLTGEPVDWTEDQMTGLSSDEQPQSGQFTVTGAVNARTVTGVKNDRQTWLFWDHPDIDADPSTEEIDVDPEDPEGLVSGPHHVITGPITVSFNVFTPTGGTWEVVPQGATDKFTITYNDEVVTGDSFYGAIAERNADGIASLTKVTFTITTNGAGDGDRLWFDTYVYTGANKTGTQYSLDSETQLYDARGYHYFQTYAPTH